MPSDAAGARGGPPGSGMAPEGTLGDTHTGDAQGRGRGDAESRGREWGAGAAAAAAVRGADPRRAGAASRPAAAAPRDTSPLRGTPPRPLTASLQPNLEVHHQPAALCIVARRRTPPKS